MENTARVCADLGHHIVEDMPRIDAEEFLRATHDVWCAHLAHGVEQLAQELDRTPSEDNLERGTYACYVYGRDLPIAKLLHAQDVFHAVTRDVSAFFNNVDVLISPNQPVLAQPLGTYDQNAPGLDAWAWTLKVNSYDTFLPLFNTTGQPGLSLPLHQSASGVPIGIQLVAGFGDEATLFRLAFALEEALPWRTRRPPVHVANF